jgi:Spy/CpxP family protein refolding chaperone
MIRLFLGAAVLLHLATAAAAQGHSPYAQLQDRTIKALSEQQIADLRAGRGMGLALPAELNGYPGPMHVLEFADALNLSTEQRERTSGLIREMKNEAIPLGERLIDSERKLERLFADREITPAALIASTEEIARLQGRLRETHLKYHLVMVELLSAEQVAGYRQLRGYDAQTGGEPHHKRHR